MENDRDFFKSIFENTGNIEAYLIYKDLEENGQEQPEKTAK